MFAFVLRRVLQAVIVINLVVDMLYFAVDPRLRVADAKGHGC